MRVLITGVTGFIGNALSKRLVDMGYDVWGMIRFTSNTRKLHDGVKPIYGDLIDPCSLVGVVKTVRPEVVIHLGALTPVSLSFERPKMYIETNFYGTVRLAEACRRHAEESLKLFMFAGTTEMFDTKDKIDVLTPFNPSSPYAVSKVCAVYYLEMLYKVYDFPTTILIPTNTYGRANVNQRHFVIEKIITSMLEGKEKILMGTPDKIRDFMFREDHVNAYISVLKKYEKDGNSYLKGSRYLFGTGVGYTILDVFKLCKKLIGWDGEVLWNVYHRPYDQDSIVVDPSVSNLFLGWEAKYDLESGLRKAIEEWKERLEI